MPILPQFIDFVNDQVQYHDRSVARPHPRAKPGSTEQHRQIAATFRELHKAMLEHPTPGEAAASTDSKHAILPLNVPDDDLSRAILSNPLELSPDLFGDLPQEILDQLRISETDKFEANVIKILNATENRLMLLDNILIQLFRMTKEVHTRQGLTNKLYRMAAKGKIFAEGRKGVYTTIRPVNGVAPMPPEQPTEEGS